MKVGDLVKADSWIADVGGMIGIVTDIVGPEPCRSARVLFDADMVLIRLDNMRKLDESR
jgi:hypothetical protein